LGDPQSRHDAADGGLPRVRARHQSMATKHLTAGQDMVAQETLNFQLTSQG
jgi:hypothetical protein